MDCGSEVALVLEWNVEAPVLSRCDGCGYLSRCGHGPLYSGITEVVGELCLE